VPDQRHDLQSSRRHPARRSGEAAPCHPRTQRKYHTQCAETAEASRPHVLAGFQGHTYLYFNKLQ
jgi:hypothetical protein